MFTSWMLITFNIVAFAYFTVIIVYYRSLLSQEKNKIISLKIALEEAEVLIKKYQIQLQKLLDDVDGFYSELDIARKDLKTIKSRFSALKIEDSKNKTQITKLEAKVDSLI